MPETEITPEIKTLFILKQQQILICQQNNRIRMLEKIVADFVLESYRSRSAPMEDLVDLD